MSSLPSTSYKHGVGIPCHILHPGRTCQQQRMFTFKKGFSQAVALYSSLGLTATVLFGLKRAILQPMTTAWYLASSSVRSALFLAMFPTIYMTSVCWYKTYATRYFKMFPGFYFIAGIFGSLSIYIERSGRKFELAMFALPRALQSLGNISVSNGWLPPWYSAFTCVSFSLSMGIILTAYDVDRSLLVPAMKSLLGTFFLTHTPKKTKKNVLATAKMNIVPGQYNNVDAMNFALAPRIEECIAHASDEEEEVGPEKEVDRGRSVFY